MTRSTLAAVIAAALIAGAGCGSDDEEGPVEPASAPTTLRVTETDFAIEPAEGRVEAPGAVRVAVVNRGEAPHSLAIETPGGIVRTGTLAPGESGHVEADLDAGTYTWFCPVGDHRARGMEGTVTVGSGTSGRPDADEDAPAEDRPGGGYGY